MTLIARTYWGGMPFDFRRPPEDAHVEPFKLRTQDFREARGLYWAPRNKPTIGVLVMHPRVDFTRHYSIPRLVEAGFGVLALNSRNVNDDTDTVHEELVLDVAAGVDHLRERVGRVVLLGNSGGGSLLSLFQSQANRAPEERIARTPAGARSALPKTRLSPADALMLIAAHRGQGHVLARCIDPAVIDEHDPALTDRALDMYAEENGFVPPPGESKYEDVFVERYRAAQLARIERLDVVARALLAPAEEARRKTKAPGFDALVFSERQAIERALHARRVMVVYRTMANLDYVDRRLDPSPREYGSLLSERPDLMNHSMPGFARTVTPRAWLSTWSASSSNADLVKTLADVREPVLVVHAEKDKEIFPAHDRALIERAIVSEDRTLVTLKGARHYFEPEFGSDDAPHVDALMDIVVPWISERFAR
jgi:alpha-beta hydrolase superfamily lysophospholipase